MKTSTIVILAGAGLVAVTMLKRKPPLMYPTTNSLGARATPQPAKSAGNANGADVATNLIGMVARGFAGVFNATGSGKSAPQGIGSQGVMYPAPTLGDFNLTAPYNPNSVIGIDATVSNPDSFQLADTGIWASGSSFGGSVVPNYSGGGDWGP